MTPPAQPAVLRRDAERNRRAVLDAARRLLARDGLAVGYADIAREAGVGMGTVYRRFPDRADLLGALLTEHVDAVVECALRATREPTGWQGVCAFMEDQLALQADDRGLRDLLRDANSHPELARSARERISPAIGDLLERVRAEDGQPAGIVEGDLLTIHLMVTGLMDASDRAAPELWRRGLRMALAGLREEQHLPGSAPTATLIDALQATARSHGS